MGRPSYSYRELMVLTHAHGPVTVDYMTVVERYLDSIVVTYRDRRVAVVTELGVIPQRPTGKVGDTFKKRLNDVLRPVGWALVSRAGKHYLLHRVTKAVYPYDGSSLCSATGKLVVISPTPNH